MRTIFVSGITDGIGGNEGMEKILSTAGKLRRWDRATDASGKELAFGFAQFEDAESLWVASKLLKDLQVPSKKQTPAEAPEKEDDTFDGFEKDTLQFRFDETTTQHIDTYK